MVEGSGVLLLPWWEQAFLVGLVLWVVEQLALNLVLHSAQSSEVDCHLGGLHGLGHASLRLWEQAFLVELVLWVVGPLEAHSEQTLEVERLAGASLL